MRFNIENGQAVAGHVLVLALGVSVIGFCGTPKEEQKIIPKNSSVVIEEYEVNSVDNMRVVLELGSRAVSFRSNISE